MEIKNLPSRITVVLLAFLISAFSTLAQAQSKRITGNVVDESDFPLPGVSILIKGTGSGTITDLDGDYSLEVPDENAVLVFSFMGYATREVSVAGLTVLDVTMTPDVRSLEEFVVVGYGEQARKDITGSVSVVGPETFEARPNSQFGNLIQGKMAGVQVVTPSGKPSAGFSIRIRGTNSISGSSEPLYVVD